MNKILITSILLICLVSLDISISAEVSENNDKKYITFYQNTVNRLLPDYRLPQETDFQYYWKFKNSFVYKTTDDEDKYKAPYWTKGLFNEDDITDYAYILINKKDGQRYLYVILSVGNQFKPILLDRDNGGKIGDMGLATQKKAKILTASGKGYCEPSEEDPPEVYVKRHAIAFFHFESAGSIFIWDEKKKKFKRHWTSD